MRGLVTICAGVILGCVLAACNGVGNGYSEYHRLPQDGWRFGDAVEFVPVHADSLCLGTFVVALRHDGSYPYTSVELEVAYDAHGSAHCDTIEMPIAGDYGQWLGRGIGASFQLTDTLVPVEHLSGSPVSIRHLMRADTLRGINQVGLFFVPVSGAVKSRS